MTEVDGRSFLDHQLQMPDLLRARGERLTILLVLSNAFNASLSSPSREGSAVARALGRCPIDALQKHRQLSARQRHRAISDLRPNKSAALKTLGKQAQAFLAPPKQLYGVASAPAKDKDVTGKPLLMKNRLHLRAQTLKPSPHVGHTSNKPDLQIRPTIRPY